MDHLVQCHVKKADISWAESRWQQATVQAGNKVCLNRLILRYVPPAGINMKLIDFLLALTGSHAAEELCLAVLLVEWVQVLLSSLLLDLHAQTAATCPLLPHHVEAVSNISGNK